jgi:hypothetical protein
MFIRFSKNGSFIFARCRNTRLITATTSIQQS